MIELRHLRYFIAAAEELHLRRAGERIHVDPTPLSRTLRDLEEQLGVRLFVRKSRKLQLTPAGIELLAHARRIFIRLERTKRVVRGTDARHREPLRVGADDSTVQPKLAACLARWQAVNPDLPVEFTEMRAAELLTALRSEEVDVGFSFGFLDDKTILQQAAWRSPIVALLPVSHELSAREVVSLVELFSFPVITCDASSHPGLRRQMEAIVERYSLVTTVAGEARSLAGYVTRVAAGLGVGIADVDHMNAMRRADIVVSPLAESVWFTTYVLHKRQRNGLPESLQRFLAHATLSH